MKIAIYGSRRQDAHLPILEDFMRTLAAEGHEVVMHPKLYRYLMHLMPAALGAVRRVLDDASACGADLAISIGGDGTFLRTAEWVGASGMPVAGVNTGHLGYLTAVGIDGLATLLPAFVGGDMLVCPRSLIQVTAPALDIRPYALNEVAILKSDTAAMITVSAAIDRAPLAEYRVDGLLVSTPTGSTAYNLSVGGPIVQPAAPVWVVSPIAAHSLSMRPLVVNDSSVLTLVPGGRAPHVRLSIDGRTATVDTGTVIKLRRAPFGVNMLHLPGRDFAATLRDKLHWGED
ncbi:MAG: NAD(+)/NADH kinase [Muribaculaceae bacterium]|nr:NAD(+)/NADH kinase [Muribaculaceae bacterium]